MSNESSRTDTEFENSIEEQHQARPLDESRSKDQSIDNSPAPMLPNILEHHSPSVTSDENEPPSAPIPDDKPKAEHPFSEPASDSGEINDSVQELPKTHDVSSVVGPKSFNTKKTVASFTAAMVGLFGLSAVWYGANQDVYTLNSQGDVVANSDDQDNQEDQAAPATLGADDAKTTASIQFTNLPQLSQGFYQLWTSSGDSTSSLGAFTIGGNNKPVSLGSNDEFKPDLASVDNGTTIRVTIESGDTAKQAPSSTVILSGEMKDNQATLSFTAIDFTQAKGVYTIAAPSDLSGDSQTAGIWFATTDGQELTGPGLSIPNAPTGWRYEGQVIFKDTAITTGKFSQANQSDSFYGFTPNPDELPSNFPGEDYLVGAPSAIDIDFPANLTDGQWKVVISLEPDQDGQDPTGDDTFALQPFKATIAKNAETYKEYELELDTSSFPTGSISIK